MTDRGANKIEVWTIWEIYIYPENHWYLLVSGYALSDLGEISRKLCSKVTLLREDSSSRLNGKTHENVEKMACLERLWGRKSVVRLFDNSYSSLSYLCYHNKKSKDFIITTDMLTDTLTILGAVTLVLLLLGAIYPHLLILTMKQLQKSLSSLNNRIVKFVPGAPGHGGPNEVQPRRRRTRGPNKGPNRRDTKDLYWPCVDWHRGRTCPLFSNKHMVMPSINTEEWHERHQDTSWPPWTVS